MDISQRNMPARHQEIHHLQETEMMDELRSPPSCRDEIVISGISGRFPESDNMEEFQKNLFEGIDMVTCDDRRFPPGIYGLPDRNGKLKNLSHFDASFFGVNPKQADVMDPQLRILLETTFEALIDAGINPTEYRGTKTGVFIGASMSETGDFLTRDPERVNGYGLLGCAKAMFPNRVSFSFDFKGPSFLIDTACSSSLMAFHQAVLSIRSGECDSAIVGGSNLILKPAESLQFHRFNMLSPEGACKAFDSAGNGYVRSEACAVVLLQKARDAKRVYATVVNTGANTDGYKEEGITFPNGMCQKSLILDVFEKAGVNPSELAYIEAHGTGTKVGDPQEVNTIAEACCKGRNNKPLLIGSVKSNMGHSEPASGVCSLAKVLIAMETGIIPGNLHYNDPNPDIPAINDGRLQVVDKNWNWNVGLTAVNSFGFGGANVHVILRPNPKPKSQPLKPNIPRLIAISGRTYESVDYFLSKIENLTRDEELITLIHDIHKKNIVGHNYRGYSVLDSETKRREITEGNAKKELWYIFSGMGCQWAGMGQAFMSLEPFSKAIHKCAAVLMDEGVDLLHLIYHGDEKMISDNILFSFVCIAAIQIALVDVLKALGLSPDGIIGHSTGELGCAYADGAFTAEQTVLAAYWRGRSIIDSKLEHGGMAAIALSWDDIKSHLPSSCVVACHNGAESVTVSGPVNDINKLVEKLKKEGIFAKKVESSGIAFHSKYIADAGPKLRSNLERIIPVAKPRSKRWISSSIPESGWSTQLAAYSSAAYHVNNLLSTVLFHEALTHIPENAVVVEIAPHCLLQAILKRDLPKSCTNIGLVKKNIPDEMAYLLGSIGKLYVSGHNPDLSVFHRPSNYPVGRGTPMISSMIEWDHSTEWNVADFSGKNMARSGEDIFEINTAENDAFIVGHKIDGRVLFPATGYITLVWKTFAKINQKSIEEIPVILEEVQFLRATIIPKEGIVRFLVNIFDGSGEFEISESGSVVVRGRITKSEGLDKDGINLRKPVTDNKYLPLSKEDIYKDLRLRGYDYEGVFRGINSADNCGVVGELEWMENWISYMDTMLQFALINKNTRELYLPTRIQRIVIDPVRHLSLVESGKELEVQMHKNLDILKSGGIEIRGMKSSLAPRRQQTHGDPILEQYSFLPYIANKIMLAEEALYVAIQIILENSKEKKIKIIEIATDKQPEQILAPFIVSAIESVADFSVDMTVISSATDNFTGITEPIGVKVINKDVTNEAIIETCQFIVGDGLLNGDYNLDNITPSIKENGFLLTEEMKEIKDEQLSKYGLKLISKITLEKKSLYLFRKVEEWVVPKVLIITEKNFDWVEDIKSALTDAVQNEQRYLLVSSGEPYSGVLGFFNCIKREAGGEHFRCLFVNNEVIKSYDLTDYAEQLKKGLAVNILRNGVWGSYRHFKICQTESLLPVEHAYINNTIRGDLSSLRWIESGLSYYRPEYDANKELCTVYYTPLNFRDIMLATGKLPPDALPGGLAGKDCILGLEFVGRDTKGNRVMGLVEARGLATSVLADPVFLWPVPDKWTMEEAATVPTVYATSYYALIVRGKMKRGESVLIHAGSGGVGQAAISIALHMGCDVFTTVGTQQKRDFLLQTYPGLKASHIGNSRDTSFEQMILEQTDGRGVDLVLNSLSEEKLQASVRCLAKHGRFLEIGKLDLSNNSPLGMGVLLKNTTVNGILLDSLFETDCEIDVKLEVVKLLSEGITSGAVRPLTFTTFNNQQIEQSFRFMATGKHIGKVILKIRDEEVDKVVKNPSSKPVPAIPRTYMHPDKSYVLVGGLGGFGLQLANWLLNRGAKAVILVSRSGVTTGYQSFCLRRWKEQGFKVIVSTANPATLEGATKLLKEANAIAPVGGIFNLAAVLRDALMENQTAENFKVVCGAKIDTTISLDKASRRNCPQLDYFVVFSSVSCGLGNEGQTNYGMANSAMERICEARQAAGFPGMAIQWGAIGDVGLVLENLKSSNETVILGTLPQRISSCLSTLDIFLQQMYPVVASKVWAEKKKSLDSSVSLVDSIKNILGIKDIKSINPTSTLADLGMDSLMGTEIKQTLERNYDILMNAAEIRTLTFEKLGEFDGGSQQQSGKESAEEVNSSSQQQPDIDGKMVNGDILTKFQDEILMPSQSIVKMKAGNGTKDLLFIVHPIEGVITDLKEVVSHLHCTVWGLQCTAAAPLESMQELAAFYVKEIQKVQPKGPYNLCGYSFGAAVAFEMALQLEEQTEKCTLVLLDGSPDYLLSQTEHFKERAKSKNEIAGEADAFTYFICLFTGPENYKKTIEELKALPDLKSRLKLCTEKLRSLTSYKEEDISNAALSFYKKLVAADSYKPSGVYQGNITLIKAEDNFTKKEHDYGLSKLCKQTVLTHALRCNHRELIKGESGQHLAQIISNILQKV